MPRILDLEDPKDRALLLRWARSTDPAILDKAVRAIPLEGPDASKVRAALTMILTIMETPSEWPRADFLINKYRKDVEACLAPQKLGSTAPTTLPEWEAYIKTLSGSSLRSKAIAANQVAFLRALEADGLSPTDIKGVFHAFVRRLLDDGQEVPGRMTGDYIDYGIVAYPRVLSE